jgi:putative component of toxin-antitoxin plasmid stabilization module
MSIWRIIFFPPSGERYSPYDYVRDLSNPAEKAQIALRLETLSKLALGDWPHTWIHKITDNIFQLTAGNHRLMYCLDEGTIVILHACRKVSQKTRSKDIKRATTNYHRYMFSKES